MKVLMIVRSNCYTSPGGDTVQIDLTAKYLRKLGIAVDIALADSVPPYADYDLMHFFNIIRPDDILPHIQEQTPFVVSTIFVDYSEYERANRKGLAGLLFRLVDAGAIEYIKAVARWMINGDKIKSRTYLLTGHNASVRRIASKAAMLLPNSTSEYNRFTKYIGINAPFRRVVNAIDPEVFNLNAIPNPEFSGHVLCVGRIEGRKNQLSLIKALGGTDIPLTIIGKPSPNHIGYYEECKALASQSKNVRFIEHISHDQLVRIYKAAKVHVLPSWFETTGLSSLEAAVMGCNIVVTKKGDTEEYFGGFAHYCEPDDVASIKEAILAAYTAPAANDISDFVLETYTWEIAAQQTLEAYESVTGKQSETLRVQRY
ncbi:glycosyltransferase involved in cell wall biosynthesis [Dyadobacter sp. BE34]|uniref:Glycosyltransferase involved in cell wall biosynthesis n=1 Tax=Dyadobacter fermentans TaxID=94254 RepID=A0ABU1R7L4_9BACT|nr:MULTISPECIES: glycosyltransferase family 4 protein [Dyadobacter]MDR6809222.1 glycosyltransferase involved in cell wall biosynthesis [Dyadobacter fermentans]MDR7046965.1 glycosyltransferase involved in cell wall biosynthesis [Dyadobacter sp. BE242]MDR7201279.1 glycosyltransferase involved in cell wall biosynthesis [Dyadobacter sp. BE34]MDR7219239.1 glycosyltransferase involved in cell wall biosynthesis [Dyadobacter sp. BE31]MDR7264551.1 glycosyltransferase involved in cell wall biosynthesis 